MIYPTAVFTELVTVDPGNPAETDFFSCHYQSRRRHRRKGLPGLPQARVRNTRRLVGQVRRQIQTLSCDVSRFKLPLAVTGPQQLPIYIPRTAEEKNSE